MREIETLHRIERIEDRQALLRRFLKETGSAAKEPDIVFDFGAVDPGEYARTCESLVGHVSIPVGIVGPLAIHYRLYRTNEEGELVEEGGSVTESIPIPMATYEGGLNASLNRGIRAVNLCGGISTFATRASMTRGSGFHFETAEEAYHFSRWLRSQTVAMRRWLEDPQNPLRDAEMGGIRLISRHARLQRVDTYVVSTSCHAVFSYSTGEACGQNMTTRNSYVLTSHFILPRFYEKTGIKPSHYVLEANTGGDKKSSHLYHIGGGHGRSVIASATLSEAVMRDRLKCTPEDLLKLREIGYDGAVLSGMIGATVNPVNVIAAIFAATGQDLACAGTSSMAMTSASEAPAGLNFTLRLPNLEVGTIGGGTGLPHQRKFLEMMRCEPPGSADKFAQAVAAAALCLEISTSCAMAAAGSLSFYTAHLERGGLKRAAAPTQVSSRLVERLGREGGA
jgi:hydroxymethylglutaryl-CoA reductase (NADPH)